MLGDKRLKISKFEKRALEDAVWCAKYLLEGLCVLECLEAGGVMMSNQAEAWLDEVRG